MSKVIPSLESGESVHTLGIDTSCYTTSVAVVEGGSIVIDRRVALKVPSGQRGLRQGEAVFQHVHNLGRLLQEVLPHSGIGAVAVSSRPRFPADSYMPVFTTGVAFAQSVAAALCIPVYHTHHQAGHIWSALAGLEPMWTGTFLAVHISGGTTDLLSVHWTMGQDDLDIEQIGGSLDLNAGQLVDRIGVKMGLSFPCGPALEKLAQEGRDLGIPPTELPVSQRGLSLNLSGPETAATRALEGGADRRALAQGIEICLVKSLTGLLLQGAKSSGLRRALIVGGVAANGYVRERLTAVLGEEQMEIAFAPPALAGDNAVGVAYFGWWKSRLI